MVRAEVEAMAQAMEERLAANDWKGGWGDDNVMVLFGRVHEELKEFYDELVHAYFGDDTARHLLRKEGADVCNFIMMVLSNMGVLFDEEL